MYCVFVFTFELISDTNKNSYETDYKITFDENDDYIIHFMYGRDKKRVVITREYKIFFFFADYMQLQFPHIIALTHSFPVFI